MVLKYVRGVIAIVLIPVVFAVTKSILDISSDVELAGAKAALVWGALSYLVLHLFFIEPTFMYKAREKVTEKVDGFLEPLIRSSSFLIPIYTLLIVLLYIVFSRTKIAISPRVFLFVLTFCFAFHILFAVKRLKERFSGALNPDYLFSLFVVFIIHIMVLVSGITVICPKVHYMQFLKGSQEVSADIYKKASKDLLKKVTGVYEGLKS